ncbi:MAG: zinc metallopeptidase [Hyphomicrobiaceae bacterium]
MVLGVIALVVVLGLATLPQLWVKHVLARHSGERADFPGSGGELARHLLDGMKLGGVRVEETTLGDHYDPETKTVRLLPQHMRGRSLTAVVVAAHEVGHAMQDATGYGPLAARTRMAKQARSIERLGSILMLTAPLLLVIFKAPALVLLQLVAGLLILSSSILMHALTLPVEFDASFARALPVLKAGGYVGDKDMPAARQILKAAAFTYVAAAAMSLLDVMRWLRMLRF